METSTTAENSNKTAEETEFATAILNNLKTFHEKRFNVDPLSYFDEFSLKELESAFTEVKKGNFKIIIADKGLACVKINNKGWMGTKGFLKGIGNNTFAKKVLQQID